MMIFNKYWWIGKKYDIVSWYCRTLNKTIITAQQKKQ